MPRINIDEFVIDDVFDKLKYFENRVSMKNKKKKKKNKKEKNEMVIDINV